MSMSYELRRTADDPSQVFLALSSGNYCEIGIANKADALAAIEIIQKTIDLLPEVGMK